MGGMTTAHLAIDLGASSGRAILGLLESKPESTQPPRQVQLEELHRFEHLGQPTPTGPVWNLIDIWRNILEGMKLAVAACNQKGLALTSVGVDCWGVDWALLGESGELLSLPHCYRDPQNDAVCEEVLQQLGGNEWLYSRTGIQLMSLNTVFQIAARKKREPKLFAAASKLVFIPDLLNYWLSGTIAVERTIASTSSLLNVESGDWDTEILKRLDIPSSLFGPIIEPGAELGTVREDLVAITGVPQDLKIIAPASHDTASAIAAVPAESGTDWAYLSSGTWSLLGAELKQPNISSTAAEVPFTNELGIDGTVRFLKNITGLWMVQELQREFKQTGEGPFGFPELMEAAATATPFRTLVNPNDKEFSEPGNMAGKIAAYAQRTGQPVPRSVGELVRCSLESLAICSRDTLRQLEQVTGSVFSKLHIVGGGSKNELLNQFIADASNCTVIAGPGEATAIGNILVQGIGCGVVEDLEELRSIVRDSFTPVMFTPSDQAGQWIERSVMTS